MTKLVKRPVGLYEAKTNLSRLVDRAAQGEEIVIAKNGRPMARLVAVPPKKKRRVPGGAKGRIWIANNFDDPLPEDVLKSIYGSKLALLVDTYDQKTDP